MTKPEEQLGVMKYVVVRRVRVIHRAALVFLIHLHIAHPLGFTCSRQLYRSSKILWPSSGGFDLIGVKWLEETIRKRRPADSLPLHDSA